MLFVQVCFEGPLDSSPNLPAEMAPLLKKKLGADAFTVMSKQEFFGHISRIFFAQGYWRNLAVNPLNLPQGPQPPAAQVKYKQKQNCC